MRYHFPLVAIATLAIAGCDQISSVIGKSSNKVEPELPRVEIDFEANLTSPDNALKSWWRYIDAKIEANNNRCKTVYQKMIIKDGYSKVATGEVQEALASNKVKCNKTTYAREILEVKVETETRAVALAKITNSTPTTVTPSAGEEKRRAEGEKYKYVIEKVGTDWRIAQVYEYTSYKEEWTPQYKVREDYYPVYITEHQ